MRSSVTLASSVREEPPAQTELPALAAAETRTSTSEEQDGDEARPFQLTPKRKKAIEAVRFIAAHLKNEDDYAEVSGSVTVTLKTSTNGATTCLE